MNARKKRAAALLLQGRPVVWVAAELGISERALRKWKEDPEFGEYQDELASEIRTDTVRLMQAHSQYAVEVLLGVMSSEYSRDSDKTKAAVALLDRIGHGPHSFQHTEAEVVLTDEDLWAELADMGVKVEGHEEG